jgi:hypothetical protein
MGGQNEKAVVSVVAAYPDDDLGRLHFPPIEEQYFVMAAPGQWKVDGLSLQLERNHASYEMSYFWLCHFGNSDAICTGKTDEAGKAQLAKVKAEEGKAWLGVMLIRTGKLGGSPGIKHLIVGQVQPVDFNKQYAHAREYGSQRLDLKKEAVQKLSLAQYTSKVKAKSESEWARLAKRK